MKIVQIIPQLSSGGAERFVVDLSNELSLRHNVVLIVSYALEGMMAFYLPEVSDRVPIHSLHKKLGFDISYLYSLYKTIKREKPDVVHTHVEAFAHFALLKWLFPRVKFVHTIHSDAQYEAGGRLKTLLKKCFFEKGWCKAVTISYKSDLSFKEYYGCNVNTTMIYNGRELDVDWAQNDIIPRIDGRYNLVSIGHLSKVKNHKLLCDAVDCLVKYGAPIELYMFGRFADNDIVDSIRALNNPHIHLLGEIPTPRIYLRNADAFCMSSVIEGMPISLIEAMSCGLIPICTAVGGIVDMIDDGKTGFLSYDMTIESYVKTIERFLELDAGKMTIMKRLCQQSAQQYSIEECAHCYEELFSL